MDQAERILQLVGTFLPVVAIVLTAFLAIVLKSWWRWAALSVIPLVAYGICSHFGDVIGNDGNMLFVALFLSYMVGLCLYYPVLIVWGVICWLRHSKAAGN